MESASFCDDTQIHQKIRSYTRQRVSPMVVAEAMAAAGLLDLPEAQRWFVEQCFREDLMVSTRRSLGDALFYKSLLHKVAGKLSREGRVMEDAVADAMMAVDRVTSEMEAADPEGRD